jgi:CDGSH-type Zn-finger protein
MSNTGKLNPHASLSISGQVVVKNAEGALLYEGDKTWLCRCGHSGNKPFCDGSHKKVGFVHDGTAAPCATAELAAGPVTVTATRAGPLHVSGPLTLFGADGKPVFCGTETWLCRCGASANKPFCDGSHKQVGFAG